MWYHFYQTYNFSKVLSFYPFTNKSTNNRKTKRIIYENNKYEYYNYLYKIILFVLFMVLLVYCLTLLNIFDKNLSLLIISIMFIMLLLFVVYYVYFGNLNRDKFDWNKFVFNKTAKKQDENGQVCMPFQSDEEKEIKNLEENAEKKLKEFTKICSNNN